MHYKNLSIMYLITDSNFGGTEASIMRLAIGMRERGYRITVCSIKKTGCMAHEISSYGIEVKSLNMPSTITLSYPFLLIPALFRWRKILKHEKPDILHSFLFQSNLLSAITRYLQKGEHRIKVFIHSLRCIERDKSGWRVILDRWALKRADIILTVSNAVRKKFLEREKIQPEKMIVVYHGITPDLCKKKEGGCELKRKLGISDNEIIIGTIARLHPDKNIETLIEGTTLIKKTLQGEIKLLIIGDGPEKGRLIKIAEQSGMPDNILFPGFQSDILPWLSLVDIFCLTSKEEGLPQSLLEAMALGKPVVATNVGGVEEVVEGNISGILIKPEDPSALSRAILSLIQNPQQAQRMGKAGEQTINNRFLLIHTLDKIEAIYKTLLKKKEHTIKNGSSNQMLDPACKPNDP